ncbi:MULTISPECIES: hypothetical protein [Bacteria]|uniref:hypothetical protein n=1 Tax=Bacteria TaxID=2 RepID=UPI003C7C2F39
MSWNFMQVEVIPDDRLIRPMIGPGGLTRDQARAEVRSILARFAEIQPAVRSLVTAWEKDADDTVYAGPFTWTIYEAEDPRGGAMEWLEDYADTIRKAGVPVTIAALP